MQCTYYNISGIFQDLKPSLTLKDTFNQLRSLQSVSDDILNRIQRNIGEESKKLEEINKRIEICRSKVRVIASRGSLNKPTTVFSTAKFPYPKEQIHNSSIYAGKPFAEISPPEIESDDIHYLPNNEKIVDPETAIVLDRINDIGYPFNSENVMKNEGLGRLPENIRSIASLLLFNSSENPYQQYTSWDNLVGNDIEQVDERKKSIAQAPKTLVEGDELPAVHGLNYEFHPSMGQHADFSSRLPTNLPLENIAEYQYSTDNTTSIAPSLFQGVNSLPDLPQVMEFEKGPIVRETGNQHINDSIPPPPPPPLDIPVMDNISRAPEASNIVEEKLDVPLPIHEIHTENTTILKVVLPEEVSEETKEKEITADPRNALLDAIRNPMNAKRLKKVSKATTESALTGPSVKQDDKKPMSIAEEMRQRMARRQAAISGKQDQLEQMKEREEQTKTDILRAKDITTSNQKKLPTLDGFYNNDRSINQVKSRNNEGVDQSLTALDVYRRHHSDSLDLSEASDWSDE